MNFSTANLDDMTDRHRLVAAEIDHALEDQVGVRTGRAIGRRVARFKRQRHEHTRVQGSVVVRVARNDQAMRQGFDVRRRRHADLASRWLCRADESGRIMFKTNTVRGPGQLGQLASVHFLSFEEVNRRSSFFGDSSGAFEKGEPNRVVVLTRQEFEPVEIGPIVENESSDFYLMIFINDNMS